MSENKEYKINIDLCAFVLGQAYGFFESTKDKRSERDKDLKEIYEDVIEQLEWQLTKQDIDDIKFMSAKGSNVMKQFNVEVSYKKPDR